MSDISAIQFQLVPRTALTTAQKGGMFQLLARHFAGVSPEQFARDLAEKNLALLLQRRDALVGFSTLMAYSTNHEGGVVNVIYSGDTIVTPEAWGTTTLPRAWVAGVAALRATLPLGPCYWMLLTSGFRTYRFLPVFWREFHPHFDTPTPPRIRRLLDQIANEQFGDQFDPATGIVRFTSPQRLRTGLNAVPAGRANDPHVTFFLSRNPGHANGDELVCLTDISPENLTAAGRRMTAPQTCETLRSHH